MEKSTSIVPQSTNAKGMVQSLENILLDCNENKENPYLVLLSYRTTPLGHQLLPVELHTDRKFITRLPVCHKALLNSPNYKAVKISSLTVKNHKQAHYYNQKSPPYKKAFEVDQTVCVYDHHSQTWEPGLTSSGPAVQLLSIEEHGPY